MQRLRKLREDQVSGLMLLVLALFVGWQNHGYPLGSLQEPGPGYVPLLIAIFLGVTGLVIAVRGGASRALSEMEWPEAKRAALILLACGAATCALEAIGYRLTIAALLVFFLGVLERRKPLAVAAVAIVFSLLSFYLLGDVLRVPLPRGPWGW